MQKPLPAVCHPGKARLLRRGRMERGVLRYGMVMALMLVVFWPIPLTQGFVPRETLQPPPFVSEVKNLRAAPPQTPMIAFVLDDLGYDWKICEELLSLDVPVTLSFLPESPFAKAGSLAAQKRGLDVLLHLPMEPENPHRMDRPGYLLTTMDEAAMSKILDMHLQSMPHPVGINNHMGSRFTQDPRAMRKLLSLIKARNLFFLDSRTSNRTVGASTGANLGMPVAMRDVFLDHRKTPEAIKQQFDLLRAIARHKGYAVAIGHPRPATLNLLRAQIPALKAEGFEIVPISKVLSR